MEILAGRPLKRVTHVLEFAYKKHGGPNNEGSGVLLYCLTAERSIAERCHYSPSLAGGFTALPYLTVLSRRSAVNLVGASSAHANGQRRSRPFRV